VTDRLNGHELPTGWRWLELGEVARYINGRAFKPTEWATSGVPIVRIENLTSATAPFNHFQGVIGENHIVTTGDLLVSWSASLDAYLWERGPAVLNQHIFKVIERKDIVTREYLFFAIRAAMGELRSAIHGGTMQHITRPKFEATAIPVPAVAEQRRIVAALRERLDAVGQAPRAPGVTPSVGVRVG
jgi:type I restriction enzyme, S subunit